MSEKTLLVELVNEAKKTNELLKEIRDSLSSINSHLETLHDIALRLYRAIRKVLILPNLLLPN
jgi:hypothetical protein